MRRGHRRHPSHLPVLVVTNAGGDRRLRPALPAYRIASVQPCRTRRRPFFTGWTSASPVSRRSLPLRSAADDRSRVEPLRDPAIRLRLTPEHEKRFEELRQRRDRAALELRLDPGVLAPRQALERLVREPQNADATLMRWQRQLLGV